MESPSGVLTNGVLEFSQGETVRKIYLPSSMVAGRSILRVSLEPSVVGAEITGDATAYLVNPPPSAQPPSTTIIPYGSTWRYLDDGSNQGTTWRSPGFNDGSWSNGVAQLGFGDSPRDEVTFVRATNSAGAAIATYYFRKSVTMANPSQFASY